MENVNTASTTPITENVIEALLESAQLAMAVRDCPGCCKNRDFANHLISRVTAITDTLRKDERAFA